MGIPSVQVWLGQEATIDAVPTWVDVTAYVRLDRGLTVTRGSTYGSGAQPGTASLTLDNTDGRFTVGNASSPLYPYVHLQSLVKMYRDGRPWFIGRVQSMPLFWPGGGDTECYVTVTLADRLARMGKMAVGSFAFEELGGGVGASTGAYWPLTESSSATAAAQVWTASSPWGTYAPLTPIVAGDAVLAFGGATGPAGDGGSAVQFTANTGSALLQGSTISGNPYPGPGWRVTFAAATLVGGMVARISGSGMIWGGSLVDASYISVSIESYLSVMGVMVRAYYANSATSDNWAFFPRAVTDGATHVFAIGSGNLSPLEVTIDGVAITASAASGSAFGWYMYTQTVTLGGGETTRFGATTPYTGALSHVQLGFTGAGFSPFGIGVVDRITAALQATPISAQAAMTKVLSWRGQDVYGGGSSIDSGITDSIDPRQLGKANLAASLAAISASEAGTLYVSASDAVTWKNRRTALSPMVTLTSADIDGGVTYNNDLQALMTLVSVTQGGATTSVQADDITTIGEISGTVTCISTVAGDGADHASWAANTGPRGPYIGSLKVDLATSTSAALAQAITGDILAGVTLTGMPSQTPPNSTKLEITGTSETVSATGWEVTWTTTPAGLGSARDLLILDDATFGVLDSTHRLAY